MTSPELPQLTKEECDKVEDFVCEFFEDSDSLWAVTDALKTTIRRRRALNESRRREAMGI